MEKALALAQARVQLQAQLEAAEGRERLLREALAEKVRSHAADLQEWESSQAAALTERERLCLERERECEAMPSGPNPDTPIEEEEFEPP